MQHARGLARAIGLACIVMAATITCVPPAAVSPGGGPPPGGGGDVAPPVDGDGGVAGGDLDGGIALAGDAGSPAAAIDAGAAPAGSTLDAMVASLDRAPPPRTLAPERPTAPLPPLRYPLDAVAAQGRDVTATMIEGDERILGQLARDDRERPATLWRLATRYRELATLSSGADAATAERAQIARLATLRAEYPTWCAAPNPGAPAASTGCADEQAYLAARAFQRLGEAAAARKLYLSILQDWPSSRFTAATYAAFGELFLGEAAADPSKRALAEQSFAQVSTHAPPEDPLYVQVRHRRAHVAWLQGDFMRALAELKHTIEACQRYATVPGVAAVGERARADLIPLYVVAGDAKRAHDFLRPLSGDTGVSTERTIAWLERLRLAYAAAGAYPSALALIQDLEARDRYAPRSCLRAVDSLELTAWALAAAGARVEQELAALLARVDDDWRTDDLAACRARAAAVALTVLLARDLDVVGSAAAPGPRTPAAVARLVELYRATALVLIDDDLAAASLPRLPAGVRPTRAWLRARADLLAPLAR